MRPVRLLAGVLALATVLLGVAAEVLSVRHLAGWLGPALFGVAAVVGVLAWLVLGAPVNRRHLMRKLARPS